MAELWRVRVCASSTEKGREADQAFYAPSIHAAIEQYKIQANCEVGPPSSFFWSELKITTQYAYAAVESENGKRLLDHVPFDQEIAHLPTSTPQEASLRIKAYIFAVNLQ